MAFIPTLLAIPFGPILRSFQRAWLWVSQRLWFWRVFRRAWFVKEGGIVIGADPWHAHSLHYASYDLRYVTVSGDQWEAVIAPEIIAKTLVFVSVRDNQVFLNDHFAKEVCKHGLAEKLFMDFKEKFFPGLLTAEDQELIIKGLQRYLEWNALLEKIDPPDHTDKLIGYVGPARRNKQPSELTLGDWHGQIRDDAEMPTEANKDVDDNPRS